jgi:uncharacterized protein
MFSWIASVWRTRSLSVQAIVAALLLSSVWLGVTAGTAVAVGPTSWPGGRWEPDPARYGTYIQDNFTLRMDDGVVLTAQVGYPADPITGNPIPGHFPVILQQDPYSHTGEGAGGSVDSYFVQRGYIFLNVNPRGTQTSGGNFDYWGPRSAQDGAEMVNFAAHDLPGSNGVVGLYGCSYEGINGLATAESVGPGSGVGALVTECTVPNVYRDYMPSGIASQVVELLPAIAQLVGGQPSATQMMTDLDTGIFSGGPLAYGSDPYWLDRDFVAKAGNVVRNHIPTLIWEGWYSQAPRGDQELYAALQNASDGRRVEAEMLPNQRVSGRYQIIVGPWQHGIGLDDALNLEWFDTYLKGVNTGIDGVQTPMHLYELGTNRWINTSRYPMTDSYTPLYLGANGALSAAADRDPDHHHHDHHQRTGAASGSYPISFGAADEPGSSLAFQTTPFSRGATIAGPISATFYASSNTPNLDLIATLSDVAPDGTATVISRGQVLGSTSWVDPSRSWRDVHGVYIRPYEPDYFDKQLAPGRIYRLQAEIFPTTYGIVPGDSLQLTITTQMPTTTGSGSAATNPCTPGIGHDPCYFTTPELMTLTGGDFTLFYGGQYPSALNVPILPYRVYPTASSGVTSTSAGYTEPLYWGPEDGAGWQQGGQ